MRVAFLLILIVTIAAGAAWGDFEAVTLTNAGLSRVVSGVSNILKTNDVKIGDMGMLDQPEMEFMIELTFKGEPVYLTPSEFDVRKVDRFAKGREETMSVELNSRYEGLPLVVYVDYIRTAGATYQEKSITITPCKEAKGAVIKRVTIDSIRLKKPFAPVSVDENGFGKDAKTAFAIVEPKSGKGICFDSISGKARLDRPQGMTAYEDVNAPVESGWQSGRVAIGAVSGTPEAAFRAYRQLLLDTRYPKLAKDPKLAALKKRFASCFAACQYLPASADGQVDAEADIADGKGFVLLFNRGSDPAKYTLSLAGLKLTGDAKLSDWTSLDKPTEIGAKTADGKIELDVNAHDYRIIGINVE